ncbi:hypothetical protein NP493_354g03033 [Ridgeia piscesae]|uniref:Uncharacterized protein n=1 Tax=Ridgeia piscesae TaxID=27915 RepID=A0AAD9L404_RIDPI|nr:hypothetical protein NP493_354g03033 [Ridgeia piscesae]
MEVPGKCSCVVMKCFGKICWSHKSLDEKAEGIFVQEVDNGQPCLNCKDKCPGFAPHKWRNICHQCKCRRELHDIYHANFVDVRERVGWEDPPDPLLRVNKEQTLRLNYTWVPPGLSDDKVDDYMDQLDNNKIPKVGSVGEKYRDLQLMLQLPKQDLAADFCKQLSGAVERKAFNEFIDLRDSAAMDVGFVRDNLHHNVTTCYNCDGEIDVGELAVFAPKFVDDECGRGDNSGAICWHPACFICCVCEEQLVDLVYCHNDGAIYCQRHYAQLLKPRCAACDERNSFAGM